MFTPFRHETFAELGFEFSPQEEAKLIADMTDCLMRNVGKALERLVGGWFEARAIDRVRAREGDEAGIALLEQYVPDWREVVEDCYDMMLGDFVDGERNWRKWNADKSAKRRPKHRQVVA